MGNPDPAVDACVANAGKWQAAHARLRAIALASGLDECVKWGRPCYALEGRNVVLIQGFKEYCALLFVKGALMPDPAGVLVRQTENVQSARQVRFRDAAAVDALAATLKAYIDAAIAVERSGQRVAFRATADFAVPAEFQSRLEADASLKSAFEALTPGRQRAYVLHFAGAKQSATRAARVERHVARILAGKGLDDR